MAADTQSKDSHHNSSNTGVSNHKELRRIGHALKPVVIVASGGLSDAVLAELERALSDHELIKVKFAVGERALKQQLISEMCTKTGAQAIQIVGNIALILRKAKKADPRLSNLQRFKG